MKKYIISILAIIAVALVVCASWLLNHNNGSKKSQREIAVYEKELFSNSASYTF
jgi:hypothetical protein